MLREHMHGYQDRLAKVQYERDGVLAVAPVGSGKTCIALTAIADLIADGHIRCALVIAPKRVVESVWPQEPQHWDHLRHLRVMPLTGDPRQRADKMRQEADVYLCSFDNLRWLFSLLDMAKTDSKWFDFLIIDEMSKLKNPYSKWLRILMEQRSRFRQAHGMTGTARPNGFEDLYGPIRLLSKKAVWKDSFSVWRATHFRATDYNQHNWILRSEHAARLHADAAQYMVAIDPDELAKLPEIVTVAHEVRMTPADHRQYKRMEKVLVAELDSGVVTAASAGVANGKCSQFAQGYVYGEGGADDVNYVHSLKFDKLVDLVDSLDGEPALVVYGFEEDLRVLREMWPGLPFLGAGVGSTEALQHERDWNARKLPLLALHPASAGHGLNLQHGGNHIIWLCLTWSPELYEQTIGRIHRQGQKERCFNHLIMTADTLDQVKRLRVQSKLTEQAAFNQYLGRV